MDNSIVLSKEEVRKIVYDSLTSYGMNCQHTGFEYYITALEYIYFNNQRVGKLKCVFEMLAEHYNVSVFSVQSAMDRVRFYSEAQETIMGLIKSILNTLCENSQKGKKYA